MTEDSNRSKKVGQLKDRCLAEDRNPSQQNFSLWKDILIRANTAASFAAAATSFFVVILVDFQALGSVMTAWLLVCASLSAPLLVVSFVWSRAPKLAMPLAACCYVVKIIASGALLLLVAPEFPYDKMWFAYSALGFMLVWQIGEITAIIKR